MPTWTVYMNDGDFRKLIEIAQAFGYSSPTDTRTLASLVRAIAKGELFVSEAQAVRHEDEGCPFRRNNGVPSDGFMALAWLHMLSEGVEAVNLIEFLNERLPKREFGEPE